MSSNHTTRRQLMKSVAVGGMVTSLAGLPACGQESANSTQNATEKSASSGGKIKQSVMAWCFSSVPTEQLIAACAEMGLSAMEGISPQHYPAMKKHGLAVSLVGSHSFKQGPVNPGNREFCIAKLRESIDLAVEWNCENVITFTGMRVPGIRRRKHAKLCRVLAGSHPLC